MPLPRAPWAAPEQLADLEAMASQLLSTLYGQVRTFERAVFPHWSISLSCLESVFSALHMKEPRLRSKVNHPSS